MKFLTFIALFIYAFFTGILVKLNRDGTTVPGLIVTFFFIMWLIG